MEDLTKTGQREKVEVISYSTRGFVVSTLIVKSLPRLNMRLPSFVPIYFFVFRVLLFLFFFYIMTSFYRYLLAL